MEKLEKEKQEIREMVGEMAMALKVSFAVLQLETPELAETFVQAWREELDALQGKLPTKCTAGQAKQKKAMISQPMGGKTEEEIKATRERAMTALQEKGFTVVNTLFTDEWYSKEAMAERGVVQIPLCFLAKSLEKMSQCDAVYVCNGWQDARGCRIEHRAAKYYGLEIIYEDQ